MKSRKIILLALGLKKSEAVYRALKGPITEEIPASILRTHKNITFIIDKDASRKL